MSKNSSSFNNIEIHCADFLDGVYIFTALTITQALLIIPLSILILHLGYQQWRQQRSFATISHSDIFTYHLVAVEFIFALTGIIFLCGRFTHDYVMMAVAFSVSYVVMPGQIGFHILTCVERYLAVVHPVLYLKMRQSGGVRIRNISTLCVWLFSCLWAGLFVEWMHNYLTFGAYFCLIIVGLFIMSFCSLRVLCVLIRPGPGEVGGNRERVDQSKRKAFYTITVIMACLWLWFGAFLVGLVLNESALLSDSAGCLVQICIHWFNLPCSLVLPLLFLHRAGKLAFCH